MNSIIQLNVSSLISHDCVHSSYYLQVLTIVQILNHTFKFIECNINLRVSENNDLQSAVLFCNDFVVTKKEFKICNYNFNYSERIFVVKR